VFKYIIAGDGYRALAVHSEMNMIELQNYVRRASHRLHSDGHDLVFRWGTLDLVNPRVMMYGDFVDTSPAIIN
jgi:hypothetical protein